MSEYYFRKINIEITPMHNCIMLKSEYENERKMLMYL
jgi:hypothetical protein